MAEDNKNAVNETANNDNGKKKKIIIVAIAVVAIAAVAAAVFLFGNKSADQAENPSGNISTTEATTLAPGMENGVIEDREKQDADQNSAPSGSSSSGSSNNGSGNNNGSNSNNNNSSGGNASGNQNSPSSGGGSTPTTEPATAPDNRELYISVVMPADGNTDDVLEIIINGKSIGTADVKTNGNIFKVRTPDKYEGDVVVEARLQTYASSASATVRKGYDTVSIALPLDGVEENFAPDL